MLPQHLLEVPTRVAGGMGYHFLRGSRHHDSATQLLNALHLPSPTRSTVIEMEGEKPMRMNSFALEAGVEAASITRFRQNDRK